MTESRDMPHSAIVETVALEQSDRHSGWAIWLSFCLVAIICIRFFSENLGLVPRVVQYIDVPLTALSAFCALLVFARRGYPVGRPRFGALLYLFWCVSLLSAVVNASRVEVLPIAMFLINFSAPLIFALVTSRADFTRSDISMVLKTFFWLGIVQLAVGLLYSTPRFLTTGNPDYVSGTFGLNAYQFTYFLGLWMLYVLGGAVAKDPAKPKRKGQSAAILLVTVAVFGLFYAAQYRAMLVFFTFVILLTLWMTPTHLSGRALLTVMVAGVSVVALIVVSTAFPNLKLLKTFDLLEDASPIVQSGKIKAVKNVGMMYADMPHVAVIGSGPATFSSRAYLVFSSEPRPEKEAAGVIATGLVGGQLYGTDVAQKYLGNIEFRPIQGGTTVASTKSSYTSLAAEVGLLGLSIYLTPYLMALRFCFRRLRAGPGVGDPLSVRLALTCFGGLILLLIQALFDNWLDTARVAIPLWVLIGLLYNLRGAPEPVNKLPRPTPATRASRHS